MFPSRLGSRSAAGLPWEFLSTSRIEPKDSAGSPVRVPDCISSHVECSLFTNKRDVGLVPNVHVVGTSPTAISFCDMPVLGRRYGAAKSWTPTTVPELSTSSTRTASNV